MMNEELLKVIEKAKARGVTTLYLGKDQFTDLPSEIGQLTSLTRLYLNSNQLTTLPPEIFQLSNLTWLDLSYNQLTILPSEITRLTKLEKLWLGNNQLTALPTEICQLPNLKELYLDGNPLTSPPYEIAIKGIDAIREYFAALQSERRITGKIDLLPFEVSGTVTVEIEAKPLNEVKILLIGDGAAGKTSLVKQLRGEAFDEHEDTTHGISIRDWQPECGGKQIRVNAWDFGGQEVQHATHQFFLSQRSLYVLVLDSRKDDSAEYWLRHVETFGGNSPVLVVLNKIDNNPSFDVNRPFLREKYPNICGFFPISCKSGKGVAEFKAALLDELAKMNMISIIWPKSWFAVKSQLEQMEKPYISNKEYQDYCAAAGIVGKESREVLADFLHDLGTAVHFRGLVLDAMSVLNPVWVTNAVYTVITAEKMADSKGFLDVRSLREILPQDDKDKLCCPRETHAFILELMQKFELCYELDRESVLIPQLLTVLEPKLTFEQDGSLRFALHYPDFLPPSVFPRFMVKVHKDIHENTCWRTGVLLEDKCSGAQALVKADVEARRINIWVHGDSPREYLHYLRYLLTDINSGFEKLKIMDLVPMPDAEDIAADYATLLECLKNGIDKYIPTGAAKVYSVHELLGLVQPQDKDELVRLGEKIGRHGDDELTWPERINNLVVLKPAFLGITFDLHSFFKELLARDKQKRRASRK